MNMNIEKRFLSLFLAFVMVLSLLPWSTVEIHAALNNNTAVSGLTITSSDDYASISGTTVTITCTSTKGCNNNINNQNETITFTNNSGSKATLSFTRTLTLSGGNVYYNDSTTATNDSGAYSVTLASGGTLKIKVVSSSSAEGTTTLGLDGITLTPDTSVTTTFKPATNGSYTVDGTAIQQSTELSKQSTESYAVDVTPNSGYMLFGWYNETTGRYLDYTDVSSLTITATATVYPVFVKAELALFGVGSAQYYDLNEANTAANGSGTIVLLNNGTLPAGDYTISSGVTLLIPFDSGNSIFEETPNCHKSSYTKPTLYRKLTMASGAHITVNGKLNVGGSQTSWQNGGNDYNGSVSGPYGQIDMVSGSTITMAEGSNLYAWGYITGDGTVTAQSGSTVYESFQLRDYRGGDMTSTTATDENNKNTYHVFPMSQYFIQNIEVLLTLEAGATENAYMSIEVNYGFGVTQQGSSIPMIGNNGAMFTLTSGSITKDFDEETGRLCFEINGEVSVSTITMSMQLSALTGTTTIDSAEFNLPIPGHMTVTALSGSRVTIEQDIALLPGSELYINEGVTCTLGEGTRVIAYSWTDWTKGGYSYYLDTATTLTAGSTPQYFVYSGSNHKNLYYSPTTGGTVPVERREKDALICIDGIIDTSKGAVYTTESGANIYSTGTGKVVTTPGSEQYTYQIIQTDDPLWAQIPITPAVLKNADGSTVETGEAAVGSTLTMEYKDGKWVCTSYVVDGTEHTHVYGEGVVTDPTCTEAGYTTHTCTVCGYSYTDTEVAATGHSPAADDGDCTTDIKCSDCDAVTTAGNASHTPGTDDGDCTTAVKCANCDQVAIAAKDSHTYGTTATDGTHKCNNCNETVGCDFTGEVKNNGDGTHAYACKYGCGNYGNQGGHSYNSVVTAPTCTAQGYTTYTCTVCGDSYVGDYVDANGHSYNSVVTAPTCTEQGYTTHTCSACGDSYVDSYVNANGHTEVIDAAVDPTCTETGLTEGKHCSVCGTVTVAQTVVAALGHSYTSEVTTDPTCTEAGVRTYTCSTCGDTYTEEVSATGHAPNNDDGDCTTAITCSVCGSKTTAAKEAHAYSVNASSGKHTCTNCNQTVDCADADNDGDHKCDYGCQTTISSCTDEDRNHKCNECGANVNTDLHKDSATDGDHVCDYGCGETLTTCCDKNTDHTCDSDSACEKYSTGDNACSDSNSDGDHVCDYGCGAVLEECVDTDKDHACDNGCDVYHGTHEDTDNDHICDYGCKETIGTCEDKDLDHDCDYGCDKVFGICEDEDNDGNHVCDYGCGKTLSECADSDTNHKCDECTTEMNMDKHVDSDDDGDHICDYGCGAVLEDCADCVWNYTDNGDGTHDAVCSICEKQMRNDEAHSYNENGVCACGNTAEAKVGETYYCFLTEAIAAATDGQTVTMLKNASGAGAVIDKSITIDFGGYTYTFTEGVGSTGTPSNGFQILQGNTVVLKNGTLNVAEEAKQDFYILIQNYADLTVTDMTLDGTNLDKWSATDGDSYVLSNNSGTVNVNGETNITANDDGDKAFAFDVCKFQNYDAPVVNVNTTGTISGKIEVSESISDNLTISGGTFTENVTVYCDAEHHTVLSGGYYVYGKHDDCEKYYLDNGNGTHDGFCKGCDVLRTDDAKHTYTASDTCDFCDNTAQAKVGEAYYYSLVEAIAAATDGQTVTMLKNASGAGAVIDKSVTIDFGGYTYTFTEGVGSTGTRSNGFQILQGNTVVLKNGTLNVSADDKDEFYILIQNYADLTVTDMTLDGTNLDKWSATDGDSYVLSNNSGTVNVNGETNITANDDGDKAFAFDVCKFQNYDAPVVNVNTTGTISGKIEVSESISDNLTISGGTFTVDVSKYCGEGYHTVDAENNGLYIYGEHVYDNGVCKCGYVQDLNVSLTIRADGAEDIQPEIPSVKYGSTLNIDLDFSSFGTCYNWNSFSVVVNGAQVPCTFANGTLTVDGQYITGNVVVVVEAIQRHTVGTMQEAAYTAPTCDAVGYRTIVTYCGKCGYSFNTTVIEIPATGHNWAVSYSWSQTENGWTCTATHSCKNSDACTVDTETVTATGSEKTAATCTEAGWTIYTANFTVDWAATQTKEEQDIPATGHDWNVSYEWKQENGAWNCIATRTCSCNASESASATVVSNVKAAATCMVNGWTTYTAVFTVPWAETQTKDVQDIPATDHKWSVGYEWEKVGDNWNCTATRICTNSETCTATETVTATVTVKTEPTCTEAGWTIYTATFAVDWAATQTKEEQDIPATGHNWSVSYEWKQENGVWICIATHTCANSTSCTEKANATVVSAVKTPANCKVAGTTTYTAIFTAPWASTQIKDVQDIPALNHNWSVSYSWTQVEGEWTCVATHTCANSDACTETATASVTGTVKTTATCTADGWTIFTATFAVDWAATQTKEEQDIPATGHSFGTTTYSWSADYSMCIAKHTCSCGAYETASAVIESATTEADCTTDGKIVYTAEFTENWAETQIEEVKIVAPGHSYGTTSYVWNSDSTACTAKRVCACGHEETATATVNTVPTAPTCTEAGYTTYTATFAEAWAETQSTVVPGENAKGHDYGAAIYTWSSDYSGCTAIRNCDCGAFETTTAVIDSDVVDATCTADGYIAYTAEFGEEWTDDQTVVVTGEKAKGHSYTETVTVPTCTESGYTTYTCACGHSYISDYVAAKGHSYTSNVTAPTCTEAGYTTYTCTCGHSYVSNYVSAKGHSYTSDVTAPTCTEAGYTTYTCTCGHSYISDYVNAAGHIEGDVQFRWDETNCVGTAYWTCETCNETFDIETTMTSVFTDGTCQVKAKTVYTATASLNGKVYTSTLTVEGELGNHEYVDGVCVHCDGLDAGKLLKGDVNLDGDVDAEDLTLLARHVTGVAEITNAAALANADVNGDHVIDSDDLTMHARYVAGIVTTWEDEE